MAGVDQGLGDDAGRVREVEQPGAVGPARGHVSAMSSTTGTVRSALAKPPAPVVSWPMQPNRGGIVSSFSRAASPPTRSCTSTNAAPSSARARSVVETSRPANPWRRRIRSGEAADHVEPAAVDVVQGDLGDPEPLGAEAEPFDQLGGVRAAAADDRDLGVFNHGARL